MTPPVRYRFEFRTLMDPPAFYIIEAGPFTPLAADTFGEVEAVRLASETGVAYVGRWAPIVDAVSAAAPAWYDAPWRPDPILVAVAALITGAALSWLCWR